MPPHGPILNCENGFVDLREKSQSQWDCMLDALEHEVNGANSNGSSMAENEKKKNISLISEADG